MLKELEAMAREYYPEAFTAPREDSMEDAPSQETEQEEGDAPQEE